MPSSEILDQLRALTQRERIPLALGKVDPAAVPEISYPPFAKYFEDLLARSSPHF